MKPPAGVRARGAELLHGVISGQASLADRMAEARVGLSARDGALMQALVFGALRQGPRLEFILGRLLDKPLRKRDRVVASVMLLGLHQLLATRVPTHAAVSESVEAVRALGRPRAAGLVNAVLRRFDRERTQLLAAAEADPVARWQHPDWLIRQCRSDWPDHWEQILTAGNEPPPMVLRVNRRRSDRDRCLSALSEADIPAYPGEDADDAIWLEKPTGVEQLPGFSEGHLSVQDESAQLVAGLMDLQPGQRVLDACAAPGGKTAHMLERCAELDTLLALDLDSTRLDRVRENLSRLGLVAECRAGDATEPDSWWAGRLFDRILLDVPWSGTGVIRRHPDIKYLRRPGDIAGLAQTQGQMLAAAWSMLAPGGRLLYTTCSVLRAENQAVIQGFLDSEPSAQARPLAVPRAEPAGAGWQRLPAAERSDGFYYACLEKAEA